MDDNIDNINELMDDFVRDNDDISEYNHNEMQKNDELVENKREEKVNEEVPSTPNQERADDEGNNMKDSSAKKKLLFDKTQLKEIDEVDNEQNIIARESSTDEPELATNPPSDKHDSVYLEKLAQKNHLEDEVPRAHIERMNKKLTLAKKSHFSWSISQEDEDDEMEEQSQKLSQLPAAQSDIEIDKPSPKAPSLVDKTDVSSESNNENEENIDNEVDLTEEQNVVDGVEIKYIPGCFKTGEIWKALWKLLKSLGWKFATGDLTVSWYHVAPNVTRKDAVIGKTMFATSDDVISFLEKDNPAVLDQACKISVEESLPLYNKYLEHTNALRHSHHRSPSGKKTKHSNKSSSGKGKATKKRKENEVFNITPEMIYGDCRKDMKKIGWRHVPGRGLASWFYLAPGIKAPANGVVDNKTSFDSVESLVQFWISDESTKLTIESILKNNGYSEKELSYLFQKNSVVDAQESEEEEEEDEDEEENETNSVEESQEENYDDEEESENEEEKKLEEDESESKKMEIEEVKSKNTQSKRPYPKSPNKRDRAAKNSEDDSSIASDDLTLLQQQQKLRKVSHDFHNRKSTNQSSKPASKLPVDNGSKSENYSSSSKQQQKIYIKEDDISVQTLLTLPESSILNGMRFDCTGFQTRSNPQSVTPSFDELEKIISMHGGVLMSKHHQTSLAASSDDQNLNSPIYMLSSPTSYRTSKYLNSVSKEVPCIHFIWVLMSIRKGKVLPWTQFILPAGLSFLRNSFVFLESWSKYFDINATLKANPNTLIPDYPKPIPRSKRILKDFTCSVVLPNCSLKETIIKFVNESGAKVIPIENADEKTVILCDANDNSEASTKACAEAYERGAKTIVSLEWITLCIVDAFAHEPTSRAFSKLQCVFCNPKWPHKTIPKKEDLTSENESQVIGSPKSAEATSKNILAFGSPSTSSTSSEKVNVKSDHCSWIGPLKCSPSENRFYYYSCAVKSLRIDEGDYVRLFSGIGTISDNGDDSTIFARSNAIIHQNNNKKGISKFGRIKSLYENAEGEFRVVIQEYVIEEQIHSSLNQSVISENQKQLVKLSPTDWDIDCPIADIQNKFVCIRGHEARELTICGMNINWQQRVFLI